MTLNEFKAIIIYMKNIMQICYRISLALLTASLLLLLFFIVVTGAEDWIFTMLGWFVLIFSATSLALFFLGKYKKTE